MSAADKIAKSAATLQRAGSETVLKGRRGTLYNVETEAGPKNMAELRARRRFAASRYFLSAAGIIKILVMILFITAGTMFLTSDGCKDTSDWYSWLYPLACLIAFVFTAFFYLMFMLGMAEENPKIWINSDLGVTLLLALGVTVISILTITGCSYSKLSNDVLGPVGLTGAALMAISAAATYIMWRYREQESPPPTPAPQENEQARKSILI